jgi:K+-transporting ATPase ATPase A chain
MLGLTVQNFVSAAAGMAVLIALVARLRSAAGDANAHRQLLGRSGARSVLYVLLPLSFVPGPDAGVSQGVVQTFAARMHKRTLLETVEFEQAKLGTDGQPLLDDKNQAADRFGQAQP